MTRVLVCGAGGFIGSHLVRRLKSEGFWVRGVDLKYPEFRRDRRRRFRRRRPARCRLSCREVVDRRFDEVYQLAADMGGAGYIFTGEHDADVMHNSATINLNVLEVGRHARTSSGSSIRRRPACIRSTTSAIRTIPKCSEDSAYPAAPDSEYGWEKLFSERLYLAYTRNYGMRSARRALSTTSSAPRARGPAARRRRRPRCAARSPRRRQGGEIEIWGDGEQTRSFLYIDECVEGVRRLMHSDVDRAGQHRLGGDGEHQRAGA